MLPVPVQTLQHESSCPQKLLTTYHIRPQDWIQYWMDGCPEFVGGQNASPADNFESFWNLYALEHPTHEVYAAHKGNLKNVVPILIHGDEGRAVKKTNYFICSIETPFGKEDDPVFQLNVPANPLWHHVLTCHPMGGTWD